LDERDLVCGENKENLAFGSSDFNGENSLLHADMKIGINHETNDDEYKDMNFVTRDTTNISIT